MYKIIALTVILALIVEFTIPSKLKRNKVMYLGIYTLFLGISLFALTKYFNLPIVSLRYGVKPEITAAAQGVDATILTTLIGLLLISFATVYEYVISIMAKRKEP